MIEAVCPKHQTEILHAVQLLDHPDLLATINCIRERVIVAKTPRFHWITIRTMAKVQFPVDDGEIEWHRRCDGGKHSFEEMEHAAIPHLIRVTNQ